MGVTKEEVREDILTSIKTVGCQVSILHKFSVLFPLVSEHSEVSCRAVRHNMSAIDKNREFWQKYLNGMLEYWTNNMMTICPVPCKNGLYKLSKNNNNKLDPS